MPLRDSPLLAPLLAASIWGGMYVVSKWGFAQIPPLTLVTMRAVLGAAVLLPLVWVVKPSRSFSRRDWRGFAGLAALLAVSLAAQFLGTDLTTAAQGSLITVLTPVFTVALGVAVLGESLGSRKAVGILLATVGTGVVLAGRYTLADLASDALVGPTLLVVAAATFAGYTAFGKRLIQTYSALETATYATALAVPLFALGALAELTLTDASLGAIAWSPALVAAVAYLGVVSTALAWYLWYKGIERAASSTTAVAFFAQPVVGIALGGLLLNEAIGPALVAGGVVLAVGVGLVSTA